MQAWLWWSVLLLEDVQYWSASSKLILQKFYDVGPGPYLRFFNNNLPLLLHLGGGCLFFIFCYLNKNWDGCIAGSLVNPLTSDLKPNTTIMNSVVIPTQEFHWSAWYMIVRVLPFSYFTISWSINYFLFLKKCEKKLYIHLYFN